MEGQCPVVLSPVGENRAGGAGRRNSVWARWGTEISGGPERGRAESQSWRSGRLHACFNGRPAKQRNARASGRVAGDHGARNTADGCSLQEGVLEVELKVGHRTDALRKETLQMLDRLEQRIGLRTGRRLLLPAKQRTHSSQLPAQSVQHMVERLQRKGQGQRFGRRFDGTPVPQSVQQSPQPWSRHGMSRQHLRQENRKTPATAATLASIAAPHPLAPVHPSLAVGRARVVTVKLAVAVQSLSSPACRTAELLKQKRCSVSSLRPCTKRHRTLGIGFGCRNPNRRSSLL